MKKNLIERSIKFDVTDGFGFPDLTDLAPAGAHWDLAEYELEQTYFDCKRAGLDRIGVRLRRRTGGPKPGWQLRSPVSKIRAEVLDDSGSEEVPTLLAEACAGVAGSVLRPVSTVTIKRQVYRLWSRDGLALIDVVDDQVSGESPDPKKPGTTWHELEMKLRYVTNYRLSNKIGDRLVRAGAHHSQWRSKLQRTMNAEHEQNNGHTHTLGELLGEHVAAECEKLLHNDVGLRLSKFVVHETHSAIRRLSSALLVFAPVFDPDRAARLLAELSWFSNELEPLRDSDVVRRRLAVAAQQIADDLVLGPVPADIDVTMRAERERLFVELQTVLVSERYLDLVAEVRAWLDDPPLTKHAQQKISAGRSYVHDAEDQASDQLHKAHGLASLQEARDAARRLRHAAELLQPHGGEKIARTLRSTNDLQILLTEHHDSLATADFLLRMGRTADESASRNGFTFGLLMAQERERADYVRFELSKRWG